MAETKIEWATTSWNPVTGCDPVSPGCVNCYARRMAHRLQAMGQPRYRDGFAVRFHPDALEEPLRWRKPRRVFVCSMGDLFHEDVSDEQIAAIWGVMAACQQHTFMVLTKRPGRMREWFEWVQQQEPGKPLHELQFQAQGYFYREIPPDDDECLRDIPTGTTWPLPNVILMVTAEDQKRADERVPLLLATPAAYRGVSVEPMLGAVDLLKWMPHDCPGYDEVEPSPSGRSQGRCRACGRITAGFEKRCNTVGMQRRPSWVIVGGESGPGARPMDPDWARSLRDQCVDAGVPFHFKQWGGVNKKRTGRVLDGRTWDEAPEVRR